MRVSRSCMDGRRRRAGATSREAIIAYCTARWRIYSGEESGQKVLSWRVCERVPHPIRAASCDLIRNIFASASWLELFGVSRMQFPQQSRGCPRHFGDAIVTLVVLSCSIAIVVCAGHATLLPLPLGKVTRLSPPASSRSLVSSAGHCFSIEQYTIASSRRIALHLRPLGCLPSP
jgi:hypothetical protein